MDSTVLITFVFVVIAGILLMMKICFASKCDNVSLCYGLISIHRNVLIENKEFHDPTQASSTQIESGLNMMMEELEKSSV